MNYVHCVTVIDDELSCIIVVEGQHKCGDIVLVSSFDKLSQNAAL